jgi:hypothetical protein
LLGGALRGFFRMGKAPEPEAGGGTGSVDTPTAAPSANHEQAPMVEPSARNLERVLAQFESMPEELADLKRSLGEVLQRFDTALDQLGREARRLSNEASELASVASRLQVQLVGLGQTMGSPRTAAPDVFREGSAYGSPEQTPIVPQEPQFAAGDPGVTIALAAVPGFQGLMDAVRALNGLAATESASVVAFKNDEASIRVALRQPVSAREIVEGLQTSTGRQALIEESRPDAQRLRLRFVEREGRR